MRADRTTARSHRRRRHLRTAGQYLLLTVVAAIVLFPIYSAVMVATKPFRELGDLGMLVPDGISLDLGAFPTAFSDANLDRYLINSLIVAVLITVGQVATSILAGYAFAYLRFPGKTLLFVAFIATLMIPAEVTIVANLETVQKLGWIDSYQALVVPFLAFAIGTFLLRQAFLGIPADMRDAATMDGYGHWGYLTRVAVPLARPNIAALSVFSFLLAWNQYLWPLLVTNSDDYRTVQIGLKQLTGVEGPNLNVIMAGTILAALPILLMLILFERQLIRGLTSGSVKG